MSINRREFMAISAAAAAAIQPRMRAAAGARAQAGPIHATIDAAKAGAPVNPMVFGGYLEPATTNVWAEMLTDRKFANAVAPAAPPAPAGNAAIRRAFGEPFSAVGSADAVVMDTAKPFVGRHSVRVVVGGEPRGIAQGRLRIVRGKALEGRVYLAGDAGAKVIVRLVWGDGPADAASAAMPALSSEFRKCAFTFTPAADSENARLEILGTGSGAFRIGTASLMAADHVEGFRPGMIRLFKDVGFKMFKWPGGNFVSAYDWRDGVGDRDRRPPRLQPMWSNRVESNDVGLHELVALCRLVGAEPDVTIDSGFGSAQDAADEVEYCNGAVSTRLGRLRADNGHPAPFTIACWTIGNEMYGPWQYGHMSLNQYAVKHNAIVDAMKAVDPTIKVTLSGASICEKGIGAAEKKGNFFPSIWEPPIPDALPFEFGSTTDWDGYLLKNCAERTDSVSEHTYAYPDLRYDTGVQRFVDVDDPLAIRARRLANRIGGAFDCLKKYEDTIPGLKERNVKFIFDEWGNRARAVAVQNRPLPGMLVPLSYGLCLHEMFRHADRIAASCATGGLRLLTDASGDAIGLPADQVVMKLLQTKYLNARPILVDGDSPQADVPGTIWVDRGPTPTGSPTYPLDVLAALSSDGKTLLLSIVNPTEEIASLATTLVGATIRGQGRLHQIAPPSVNAANEASKPPVVDIVERAASAWPDAIDVPPVSVSLWEFPIA